MNNPVDKFNALLSQCVTEGASDLHLSCCMPPCLRIHGKLQYCDTAIPDTQDVPAILEAIGSAHQHQEYQKNRTVDIGYSSPQGERFRVNIYQEMGRATIAARHLDQRMLTLEDLRLPVSIASLANLKSGLVLVTGATGSGKSTTLAAIIDRINKTRACHILTVEDPVEFVHVSQKSLVHHRELHNDVPSFAAAVRASLREDPDVIMVGEMRDIDTMRAAITAAETGHLVFSTLHTGEAVGCIERLVGSFPGEEQDVARHRIAMALKAVVAQHLIALPNGGGRTPAIEILMVNQAVANLIENGKTRQIFSVMETSSSEGMQTLDQSLAALVKKHVLRREDVLSYCHDVHTLDRLLAQKAMRTA